MATFAGLSFTSPGIKSLSPGVRFPDLPFRSHSASVHSKFKSDTLLDSTAKPLQTRYFHHRCTGSNYNLSVGKGYQLSINDDDSDRDPYLLILMREAIVSTRGLFQFIVEQPSQLRYIEWPGFQSTLKTAALTLVIVAFLIVALSSIDSALSYLLAFLLRRKS